MSTIPFTSFMDRIMDPKPSPGVEGVLLGDANDVVLLASLHCDLQLSLQRFAAECKATGMKSNTSKCETMVPQSEKCGVTSPGGS